MTKTRNFHALGQFTKGRKKVIIPSGNGWSRTVAAAKQLTLDLANGARLRKNAVTEIRFDSECVAGAGCRE
jgi:hypothetical protein